MLNQDYTAKVLNLEDVIITNVENISDVLHICLELPRQKHRCPACGALTDRIHDYRMQTIKDIPMGRETLLHLRKRRYRCSCGKRFFEKNSFLPRYYRITSRLVAAIITAFRDTVSSARIGTQYHVSGTTAMRYFKCVGFRPTELPRFFLWTSSRVTLAVRSITALPCLPLVRPPETPRKNGGSAVSYAPSVPRFSMIASIIPSTSRSSLSLRELSRMLIRFFAASSAPMSG